MATFIRHLFSPKRVSLGEVGDAFMRRNGIRIFASSTASILRGSIVVSISACHADDPGSIPGRGIFYAPTGSIFEASLIKRHLQGSNL